MAGRKFTRRATAPRKMLGDPSALESDASPSSGDLTLVLAIEAQRKRMFQASAIAACLGHTLEDICPPGKLGPELQNVTDAMIQLLDDAAAALDPTVLKLPSVPLRSAPED